MRAPRFALCLAALAALASCRGLRLDNGTLQCGARRTCPPGYACGADDRCWTDDGGVGDGAIRATGGAAGGDASADAPADHAAGDVLSSTDATSSLDGPVDTGAGETAPPSPVVVTIDLAGNGSVTGAGISDCKTSPCMITVASGGDLSLTAKPGSDSNFSGWTGCASATGTTCSLMGVTQATTVTATFALKNANLVISKSGNGTGKVTATWTGGGLDCGATCSAVVPSGVAVTLTATPDAGSTGAFGAPCAAGGTTCLVTAGDAPTNVAATFTLSKVVVTVARTGAGSVMAGTTSCSDASCPFSIDYGGTLVLQAAPGANYEFGSWTGCTSTSGTACSVANVKAAAPVGVTFVPKMVNVTITRTGNGSVASSDNAISCSNPSCVVPVAAGSTLMLVAQPASDSMFTSWQGCSSVNGATCTLTNVTSAAGVTATFALKNASFVISKQGNGAGTVTATWAGGGSLSCGSACSASILPGTVVTLAATPSMGSSLAWGAPCSGSGGCQVTVAAGGTTATATFTLNTYLLSVTLGGPSGTGSVLSTTSGVGIACGATCSALVAYGTSVQLAATATSTGSFASWSGCSSTAGTTCTVDVMGTANVTATFKFKPGQTCTAGSDCSSGVCVGGYCCTGACAGPCNACQLNTGNCAPLPARTACGVHTGPGGAGNGSDVAYFCNGAGSCVAPTIQCSTEVGPQSCDLSTEACCSEPNSAPACLDPSFCDSPSGPTYYGYSCATATDCPLNQVCCYQHPNAAISGDWAVCVTSCNTGPPNFGTVMP